MHRVLFTVPSFRLFGLKTPDLPIYSYGLMLILAFFVGVWIARKRAARYGIDPERIWDVAFWMLIGGVLGARILFILQDLSYFLQHRDQLLTLRFEGLTSFGGVIGGLIAIFVWCAVAKVPVVRLLDVFAPCFLIGHAIGRVGCLLNGCCYGGACDLPWGITVFDSAGHALPGHFHPAQIYDSLMNLAAVGILFAVEARHVKIGQIAGLAIVLHGLARFIYEFWRAGVTSDYYDSLRLTDAQLAALALVAVGAVMWFVFGARKAAPSS